MTFFRHPQKRRRYIPHPDRLPIYPSNSFYSQRTGKTRSALQDVVSREYTIHLHKRVHVKAFKKRAPTAVKSVIEFARKAMGTSDVRLDPKLNQALWARGIKSVPHRIRVKLERECCWLACYLGWVLIWQWEGKRNDEENAKEKLFTYASHVEVTTFKVRFHPLCVQRRF